MNNKEQLKYLKNLSKNIKKIRKEKGLTQADCNVDERTIRRIENESFNPSLLTLLQIATGLDVTLIELLNFE